MFCVSCGKQLPFDAVYCPFCGTRQPILESAEQEPLAKTSAKREIIGSTLDSNINYPSGDVEPLFFLENATWLFKYKTTQRPPEWVCGKVDVLVSNDYVFIISNDDGTNRQGQLAFYAKAASVVAAGAVPILGIAAGLAGMAAASIFEKKIKHPGYGKHNQFSRDALFEAIAIGRCLWLEKQKCEFSAYRYRESFTINIYHCFSIAGDFHTSTNDIALAAYKNLGYNAAIGCFGDSIKDGMQSMGKCALSQDIKVRSDEEALSLLSQSYPNELK